MYSIFLSENEALGWLQLAFYTALQGFFFLIYRTNGRTKNKEQEERERTGINKVYLRLRALKAPTVDDRGRVLALVNGLGPFSEVDSPEDCVRPRAGSSGW